MLLNILDKSQGIIKDVIQLCLKKDKYYLELKNE